MWFVFFVNILSDSNDSSIRYHMCFAAFVNPRSSNCNKQACLIGIVGGFGGFGGISGCMGCISGVMVL